MGLHADTDEIRTYRQRLGLSVEQVCERPAAADVHLAPNALRNIETGKRTSVRTLQAIAGVLGVPMAALVRLKDTA